MKTKAYCLDWHVTKSDAFVDILVQPLRRWMDIELTAWDGADLPRDAVREDLGNGRPLIFCQFPPPASLLQNEKARLVWLPMWDHAKCYPQEWWNALPKHLRVVAFSRQVIEKASAAGLDHLPLRYFKDPSTHGSVEWTNGNTVFYWNRTGLVSPLFLKKFCQATRATRLIFRDEIDPRITSKPFFALDGQLGGATVVNIRPGTRESYLEAIQTANLFIAPRASEGVGMSFLEAMARGCAVFAHDGPTMNEYIQSRENGFLFASKPSRSGGLTLMERLAVMCRRPAGLTVHQQWKEISELNYRALGDQARALHSEGFTQWQSQLAEYASFVQEW